MKNFKKIILLVVVLIFVSILLVGCSGGLSQVQVGSVSGIVADATTGDPLNGASVQTGSKVATTGADGNYTLTGVPVGTATITAFKTGYISASREAVILVDQLTPNVNFALSPELVGGENFRIVLTWGENPRDLDSHLLVPVSNTDSSLGFEVYYANRGSETSHPYAELDVDDTSSYGPETITIYTRLTQLYKYFVYLFAGTGELTTSQAVVKVYDQTGLIRTYTVPTTGTGLYWYVFDISAAGGIITRDIIQSGKPTLP